MSLVPIIYTSLVLFFGLLLIVTIVSYITFRAKSRINPVIEQEVKNHQKNIIIKKQHEIVPKQIIVPILSETQLRNPNAHVPVYADVKVPQNNYPAQGNSSRKMQDYQQNYRRRESINNTSFRNRQTTRIEIMNDSAKFQRNKVESYNTQQTKNYRPNLSEFNFLNYYSDYPEAGLTNITTAQNRAV